MHEILTRSVPHYLLNSKNYFVVALDLDANYTFVNTTFQERYSFITNDFIGKPSTIAIYVEDYEPCFICAQKCFAEPDKSHQVKLRKPEKIGGSFSWSSWEFSLLKDSENNPVGIFCVGHEITDLEKVNEEARKFSSKVNTILEEITEGFYQVDNHWKIVRINRTAETILNVSRDEVLEKKLWEAFCTDADDEFLSELRWALKENKTTHFEKFCITLNKWILTTAYASPEGLTVFIRDVTADHESRANLQFSESKLKAVLDSTKDRIIVISPELKIIDFNKAAKQFNLDYFGQRLLIGTSIHNYFNATNREHYAKGIADAAAGTSITFEICEDIEAQPTWFEVKINPVFNDEQNLIGVTIHSHSINEKKQSELKIIEQEYLLRAIYHSTSEASTFIDKNRNIRYMNEVAKGVTHQIFGKEPQVGDDLLDYVLPQYQEEFNDFFKRTLAGENISVERSSIRNWWQILFNPVYDNDRNSIGVSYVVKDISARKIRELKLRESEEVLQKTIEAIPHPLVIVNHEGAITFINAQFELVFGYCEEEILGKTIDFFATEQYKDSHTNLFNEYLRLGGKSKPLGHYLYAQSKEGKQVVIDASLNSFTAGEQRFVIMILQDVTRLKRHQDIILKQNLTLKSIAWQQSHEVRRPLANILGMYALLKDDLNTKTEDKQKYLDHLFESTQELDKIIHKIVQDSNTNGIFSAE